MCVGGGDPITFSNKECHIKGRTCAAFCCCLVYEIRSGTMKHIGMTFINLITELLICRRERERRRGAETSHWGRLHSLEWMGFVKAVNGAGRRNVAHISTP